MPAEFVYEGAGVDIARGVGLGNVSFGRAGSVGCGAGSRSGIRIEPLQVGHVMTSPSISSGASSDCWQCGQLNLKSLMSVSLRTVALGDRVLYYSCSVVPKCRTPVKF